MTLTPPLEIAIAGAGAVGCFVGGLLAAAGHKVTLLGRERVLDDIRQQGLHLSDFAGLACHVSPEDLNLSADPAVLRNADLIIVAVKSGATIEMAQTIRAHRDTPCPVLSFQNGITNVARLRKCLADWELRAAMVPFNVVPRGNGRYHRASSGDVVIGETERQTPLATRLTSDALKITASARIEDVLWGKLLLNLNNAVNALSGQPLRTQMMDRQWRAVMAAQLSEALRVYKAAGITPVSPVSVPVSVLPFILRLPTPIFRRIAAKMLSIDPHAKLSMAQDLDAGRLTEIDELQGEILKTAAFYDIRTPVCAAVTQAIKSAEQAGGTFVPIGPKALK
ncbi:MAG: 2-dehydropantoate 2-reductase [Paracoccaceae bacterium]